MSTLSVDRKRCAFFVVANWAANWNTHEARSMQDRPNWRFIADTTSEFVRLGYCQNASLAAEGSSGELCWLQRENRFETDHVLIGRYASKVSNHSAKFKLIGTLRTSYYKSFKGPGLEEKYEFLQILLEWPRENWQVHQIKRLKLLQSHLLIFPSCKTFLKSFERGANDYFANMCDETFDF